MLFLFSFIFLSNLYFHCGAQTHDLKIKSQVLCGLRGTEVPRERGQYSISQLLGRTAVPVCVKVRWSLYSEHLAEGWVSVLGLKFSSYFPGVSSSPLMISPWGNLTKALELCECWVGCKDVWESLPSRCSHCGGESSTGMSPAVWGRQKQMPEKQWRGRNVEEAANFVLEKDGTYSISAGTEKRKGLCGERPRGLGEHGPVTGRRVVLGLLTGNEERLRWVSRA